MSEDCEHAVAIPLDEELDRFAETLKPADDEHIVAVSAASSSVRSRADGFGRCDQAADGKDRNYPSLMAGSTCCCGCPQRELTSERFREKTNRTEKYLKLWKNV